MVCLFYKRVDSKSKTRCRQGDLETRSTTVVSLVSCYRTPSQLTECNNQLLGELYHKSEEEKFTHITLYEHFLYYLLYLKIISMVPTLFLCMS